ncbi:MAG: 50S ribosomal protein L25 [Firmicutes bacterium]|nr:50S ribosomal protein L25 [Candidatus Fermentithermobacillaceae bacterium]
MPSEITAVPRQTGKRVANKLRKQGFVPAVIYGKTLEPIHVALTKAAAAQVLGPKAGHVHRIVVKEKGFDGTVVLKEVQKDPISRQILHLDFHHVSMGERVRVEVPIVLAGEDEVEKRGFVVQRQMREIEVECLPEAIPDALTADVSGLAPGHALLVKDLVAPKDVEILAPPTEVVAVVVVPRTAAEEVTEAPAGEAAASAGEQAGAKPEEPGPRR